jgi:hypothetical protein
VRVVPIKLEAISRCSRKLGPGIVTDESNLCREAPILPSRLDPYLEEALYAYYDPMVCSIWLNIRCFRRHTSQARTHAHTSKNT